MFCLCPCGFLSVLQVSSHLPKTYMLVGGLAISLNMCVHDCEFPSSPGVPSSVCSFLALSVLRIGICSAVTTIKQPMKMN